MDHEMHALVRGVEYLSSKTYLRIAVGVVIVSGHPPSIQYDAVAQEVNDPDVRLDNTVGLLLGCHVHCHMDECVISTF